MARKNKEPKAPKEDKKVKAPKAEKAPKEKKQKVKKPRKELEQCGSRVIGNPVRVLIITAVISAVIGLALFQFYNEYKEYFDYIVGGLIILAGLVSIIFYFAKRMFDGVYRSEFAIGIVCVAFGLYVALNGGASFSFLIIIGALATIDGVIKLQYTLDLARMRFSAWWLTLIFAILGIAIGVAVLMGLPGDVFGAEEVAYTGIALCANALFDVVCAIVIAVRNHKAAKARKNASIIHYTAAPAVEENAEAELPETAVEEAAEEDITVEVVPEEELPAEPEAAAPAEEIAVEAAPEAEPVAEEASAAAEAAVEPEAAAEEAPAVEEPAAE